MTQTKLNTTAYCLLGLFKKKPWTAYELAQFMEVSAVRTMLPRTRSQIFNEPKKMAKQGLLSATETLQGSRKKTTYSITPLGEQILADWLKEAGDSPRIEHISLLKFYLTSTADIPALQERIAEMRQQILDEIKRSLLLVDQIVDRGTILDTTAPNASMIGLLGSHIFESRLQWLAECEKQLHALTQAPDTESLAIENYQKTQQSLYKLLETHGSQ
jgi:DNA-binding PadR family transcriptional regulator